MCEWCNLYYKMVEAGHNLKKQKCYMCEKELTTIHNPFIDIFWKNFWQHTNL